MITNVPNTEFLYFLADKNWKTFSIENGAVKKNALPTPLPQHPIGWKELEISYSTNQKYWSLNKAISASLKFVGDGAKIIRYHLYKGKSYEEELYVIILRWNNTNGTFEKEYIGRLDLTKAVDDPQKYVTVNSSEGGLVSYLANNDGVTYEIDNSSTATNAVKVKFDSVTLFDKLNYKIDSPTEPYLFEFNNEWLAFPNFFFNNEGDSYGIVKNETIPGSAQDSLADILADPEAYYFYAIKPISVTITGALDFYRGRVGSGTDITGDLTIETSKGNSYLIAANVAPPDSGKCIVPINLTISLDVDEKLFIVWHKVGGSMDNFFGFNVGNNVSFSLNTPSPESEGHYARYPIDVLQELVSKMTEGRYTAQSSVLSASKIALMSGDAVRKVATANIKTTFADFFQSYNSIYNLGIKIVDNVLYVERKEDLYNDNTELFDVGEVSKLEIDVATECIANILKSGFPNQNYNERNGKYEFNTTLEMKLPVNTVKKEYNIVSKYRGDCFGIIFNIINLQDKSTTDNKGDTEVFMVHLSDNVDINGNYLLERESYSSITGVVDNTVFNIKDMTPKRQVMAHGNYLASILYQQKGQKITFQSLDKNKDLKTVLGTEIFDEDADVLVNKLGSPLFLPYVLKFKPKAPYTFSNVMNLMNAGNIKLSYNGYTLYGLPIGELSVKTASKEAQEWKLLCSPKSSLDTLFKLSANGLFITSYNNNMLFISNINPVHWLKYNHVTDAKHHHKDIYDDWVANRNDRMIDKPFYFQKWQKSDTVKFQFITANVGQLEVFVYDDAANQIATQTLTIQSNASIVAPYSLQEGSISLSGYDSGKYIFVLKAGSENLAISEWQHVAEDHEKTYLIEYSNTYNKQDGYFDTIGNFQLRVESLLSTEMPSGAGSDYEDESDNTEILHGIPSSIQKLYIGDQKGVPDWMGLKVNAILFLNRVQIEGIYYSKRKAEDQLEPNDIPGYPFHYYVVDVKKQFNEFGLTINDSNIPQPQLIYSYTLDAKAFGGQSGATINIQTTNT